MILLNFKVQDGTTLVQPHTLGNVQQGQVIQLPAGSTVQQGKQLEILSTTEIFI